MRNCAGVCSRGTLHRYCSSRISGGTHSAVQTSFTTIETKRYSSGRKNTPANIGKHISNLTERTSRCSRRHFRSALRNPGCLRSPRTDNCGGRPTAMHGGNRGRSLRRATSTASAIACNPAFRWESWSLELCWNCFVRRSRPPEGDNDDACQWFQGHVALRNSFEYEVHAIAV